MLTSEFPLHSAAPEQPRPASRRFLARAVACVVVLASAMAMRAAAAATPAARGPNIVFIMGDDLGYGDPRCYNPASKIPTPNLDRLAAEGIRFSDAHSPAAVCTPTRYGVLTGRYCWRTRLKRMVLWTEYEEPLIEPGRVTVASLLRGAGYRTAAVGKWHLGANFPQPGGGFVRGKPEHFNGHRGTREVDFTRPIEGGPPALGFDTAFYLPGGNNLEPHFFVAGERVVGMPTVWRAAAAPTRPGTSGAEVHEGWMTEGWSDEAIGPTLTEQALRFIDASAQAQQPFFLYYASQAPHRACTPPDFALGKSQAGVRGDMVYELDWTVGKILAKLEERGVARDTLVIVTSDNGAVAKSDEGEDFGHKSCGDLRGFKGGIYEGGHRVPFLARWPARMPAGQVNGSLVVLTDMLATFAELAGVKLPPGAGPDGASVVPALLGATMEAAARPAVVLHSGGGQFALRSGPWKLIFNAQLRPVELYHLEQDLREQRNQLSRQPDLVARMQQEFQRLQSAGW